jgi:predicted lipoprotein with Yx(FWY)xxD motif
MDGTGDCARIRTDLGVYVLGAISAADRAVIVAHLASCARCREELAGLARLPGLLRTVPAQAAAGRAAENGRRDPALPARLEARLIRRVARRRRRQRWLTAASIAVLAAAAGAGWAAQLERPALVRSVAATTLLARRIGPVTVLTDQWGFTVYWFGPDTVDHSRCGGRCALRWPPVTGPVAAGPGAGGVLGSFTRPGGVVQATYDGHPLYTASVDTAPGQDRGNNLDAAGGIWHAIIIAGTVPTASPAVTGYGSLPRARDESMLSPVRHREPEALMRTHPTRAERKGPNAAEAAGVSGRGRR